MSGLYSSGWKPARTKASWDRCSMGLESTKRAYGPWLRAIQSEPTEAVGWFDDDGACRQLVVAFENGKHMLVRHLSRTTSITFPRIPTPSNAGGGNG